MTDRHRPLFFIHIMKTGGTTLKFRILDSFPEPEVYPNNVDDPDQLTANLDLRYLTNLSDERRNRTRAFGGHFPFAATEMLAMPLNTVTVLRDPVERVVSHLKQVRKNKDEWTAKALDLAEWEDPTLETIYDNPFMKPRFFENYQSRLFSITAEDDAQDHTHILTVDAKRLDVAKANLQKVDVVGLTEDLAAVELELHHRFGISDRPLPRMRVSSDDWEVPLELRARIADDNAADIAFYEHAKQLIDQRRSVP